ncbi:MAG: hypothetical protein P8164_13685 [Gammaproteobacteria bacterium]|jgi:hypothetical protein
MTFSKKTPGTGAEEKITFEHAGQEYSASYTVNGGIVSVTMADGQGALMGTSTFADGSPVDSVVRSLLWELLRDAGFF